VTRAELFQKHRAVKSPRGGTFCYSCGAWDKEQEKYLPVLFPCDARQLLKESQANAV